MAWLWFGHKQMNELLGELIEPLEALGSRFKGKVYSHHHEYRRQYENTQQTLQRLIRPFVNSKELNWTRVIPCICPNRQLINKTDF
ncbi:P22AR C-terminal domain-containing protein [Volucribacter amazonae]|uniref:P22AR C-terminal domain-containing protein n=1 Tax=Volucribacter amazonae TaxID=256731 RepID=UPI003C748566